MKRKVTALKLVPVESRPVAVPPPLAATPQLRVGQAFFCDGMRCPGCGRGAWLIGRSSAECAKCAMALPLASASAQTKLGGA